MKRIYIKPETEPVACKTMALLAGSNNTQWHEGDDPNPLDPDEPNPNEDDTNEFHLWEFEE